MISNQSRFTLVILLSSVLLVSGCASMKMPKPPDQVLKKAEEVPGPQGWWYARFGIKWPDNAEPSWHVDLFLADRIIGPVLQRHENGITLWRFHRRAARDNAGHTFSFIFYSSSRKAHEIFEDLQSSPQLKDMKNSGLIVREEYDSTTAVSKPNIEDTSDRSWSRPVQRSWPYFIRGVSEMWLRLIQETRENLQGEKTPKSISEALAVYQQVNGKITELWRDEGRHALLHHLNALFGYEPLVVYEKKLMGF